MTTQPLHTGWQFKTLPDQLCLELFKLKSHTRVSGTLLKKLHQGEWLQAQVPGYVHLDLMRYGKIPDPFLENNENEVQWVEEENWLYRCHFASSDELTTADEIELCFDGIDTVAVIILNGHLLAKVENMFRSSRYPVKQLLKTDNELLLAFRSPKKAAGQLEQQYGRVSWAPFDTARVYLRRAQCLTGWDWGPRLSGAGLWRPVNLESVQYARIDSLWLYTEQLGNEGAVVRIAAELKASRSAAAVLNLTLIDPEGENVVIQTPKVKLKKGRMTSVSSVARVNKPKLWMPAGYGNPHLYELRAELAVADKVIDSKAAKVGIRTVKLETRRLPEDEESFALIVNGCKVFARGYNWIPADIFLPRVNEERYEALLQLTAWANVNMLRVWGGGIYEDETFYEICDRLGLMVWQDFMFACAPYPDHQEFQDNVSEEATEVIKRLRHHPSIVLWCGNNENEWIEFMHQQRYQELKGLTIWQKLLRQTRLEHDPSRPYWQSSPFGREDPNSPAAGDRHNWEVWSGWKPLEDYLQDTGLFLSEYGFQSLPDPETITAFTQERDVAMESPALRLHQKFDRGPECFRHYLKEYLREPQSFQELVYLTQVMQAEALKLATEHWRARKPLTAGTLIWQFNDCWPVISWSHVDYHLRPKAAYYYARRFFSPLLLLFHQTEKEIKCQVVNDTLNEYRGSMEIVLSQLDGTAIEQFSLDAIVPPNANQGLLTLESSELLDKKGLAPSEVFLYGCFRDHDRTLLSENACYFERPNKLHYPRPNLSLDIKQQDEKAYELVLCSDVVVRALKLELKGLSDPCDWSDNFFDLFPQCEKTLACQLKAPLTEEEFYSLFSITSLNDLLRHQ